MAAPQRVVQAVQAGIVASAHMAALRSVAAAAEACHRLGQLTSGRWRAAARDLTSMEDDLQRGLSSVADSLVAQADEIGVSVEALWTVGDAAGTFDLLRDAALDEVEEDDAAAVRVLEGEVLFGASFVEDPDLPDRGTTLLYGWPDPLEPASWPWQANWVVSDGDSQDDDVDSEEELDLFENGELEGDEALVAGLADALGSTEDGARAALRGAAMALTRASLLAYADEGDEEDDEDDDDDGAV